MTKWTPELEQDALDLTPRQFEAKHPGLFSSAAVHIKRRLLRDAGRVAVLSPIGRTPDPVFVNVEPLPEAPTADELWAAYDGMYEYLEKYESAKASSEISLKVDTDRPFGIAFMSDFHLGSRGVDTKQLRQDIDLINTCDHLKAYVGGDGIDNFVIPGLNHVHRDSSVVPLEIQFELFKHIILQLLPSLLAVGTGNHDAWTKRMAGIEANLAALASVPVLHTKEDTWLNLEVGEQTYTVFRKHRPATSSRNDDIAGIKHAFRHGTRPFDVGVQEHHHTPAYGTFWGHNQERIGIRTGSYKLKDKHAREFGFMEGKVGTPVVVFHPYEKHMEVFRSLSRAIDYLEAQ